MNKVNQELKNFQYNYNKIEKPKREPDPGNIYIKFIAWLKKRGSMQTLYDCNRKYSRDKINIDELPKLFGIDKICIYRRSSGGKVIRIEDLKWADQWMIYYDEEVPHHTHFIIRKKKLQ